VFILKIQSKKYYFKNLVDCLTGKKTFVSYSNELNDEKIQLPNLKSGILTPTDSKNNKENPLTKTNLLYAKNYTFLMDLEIIYNNWQKLDRY
jgi:hypothetical protein